MFLDTQPGCPYKSKGKGCFKFFKCPLSRASIKTE